MKNIFENEWIKKWTCSSIVVQFYGKNPDLATMTHFLNYIKKCLLLIVQSLVHCDTFLPKRPALCTAMHSNASEWGAEARFRLYVIYYAEQIQIYGF